MQPDEETREAVIPVELIRETVMPPYEFQKPQNGFGSVGEQPAVISRPVTEKDVDPVSRKGMQILHPDKEKQEAVIPVEMIRETVMPPYEFQKPQHGFGSVGEQPAVIGRPATEKDVGNDAKEAASDN